MMGATLYDFDKADHGDRLAEGRVFLACAPEVAFVDAGMYYHCVEVREDMSPTWREPGTCLPVANPVTRYEIRPERGPGGALWCYLPKTHTVYVWKAPEMSGDEVRAEACKLAFEVLSRRMVK